MLAPLQSHRDQIHLSGYQRRDLEVVDYQMYQLTGTGLSFRGPEPRSLAPGRYFTCLGAAQTFGCFCPDPYPSLLQTSLKLPALNLGYGGAGPEFFVGQNALLEYINRGRFAVVQIMSARSQSNSEFDAGGLEYLTRRSDNRLLGAREAYQELIRGKHAHHFESCSRARQIASKLMARPKVRRVVQQTRDRWVESYRLLLTRITVPTVLLWFSRRSPDYRCGYRNVSALFGDFPQLVTQDMVDRIRVHADHFVSCVTSRGHPQPLTSRYTGAAVTVDPSQDRLDLGEGQRWTHNRYYPSPEMQEDAKRALHDTCAGILIPNRL